MKTRPEPGAVRSGRAATARRRTRWRLLASPLTRRVLVVNLLAPVILVFGLFYLDRYKQGLIHAELTDMTTQAEMVAGAVGEGAVSEQALGFLELNRDVAQQMVRRLAEPAQVRARLFDPVGDLAADSRFLLSSKGAIQIEPLPRPDSGGLRGWLHRLWETLATWMPDDKALPPYREHLQQRGEHYPEVLAALSGHTETRVRARHHGIILSVAVPVQRYKQVVGALMLSADGSNVARSLFQVRLAIVEIFAVVLMITTLLSLKTSSAVMSRMQR